MEKSIKAETFEQLKNHWKLLFFQVIWGLHEEGEAEETLPHGSWGRLLKTWHAYWRKLCFQDGILNAFGLFFLGVFLCWSFLFVCLFSLIKSKQRGSSTKGQLCQLPSQGISHFVFCQALGEGSRAGMRVVGGKIRGVGCLAAFILPGQWWGPSPSRTAGDIPAAVRVPPWIVDMAMCQMPD